MISAPVSVNIPSAFKNISVRGFVPWHFHWSPVNYSPPTVDPGKIQWCFLPVLSEEDQLLGEFVSRRSRHVRICHLCLDRFILYLFTPRVPLGNHSRNPLRNPSSTTPESWNYESSWNYGIACDFPLPCVPINSSKQFVVNSLYNNFMQLLSSNSIYFFLSIALQWMWSFSSFVCLRRCRRFDVYLWFADYMQYFYTYIFSVHFLYFITHGYWPWLCRHVLAQHNTFLLANFACLRVIG